MFGFGKKISEDEHVYAPVTGEVIPLDKVSDPVFAQKMMGDGYAVEPNASKIVSPVSGEVTMVQGHAVGLKRFDDLELLVHIGIDTVSLNGKPFTTAVKEGDIVDAGDDLVTVNWEQVEEAGLPKTTLVLITNTADKLESITVHYGPAVAGQQLGSAKARRD